ncbi:MAG: hypoxanthine phosphoribosyltransferase [Deltaproteobacteria bacterium]|nr:hypoxanthine phosphoribosyltransferase [Candidatus Anaeroferrophillus wilburensis]MBN2889155.1 hypoxanthine phosphoribosyltransferase [Deltaproteobacteria bacterium]
MDTVLNERQIEELVARLAREIAIEHQHLMVVGLLKGCLPFMADLSRALCRCGVRLEMGFMRAKSYFGDRSSGHVQLEELMGLTVADKDVLVVDDILDTGHTLRKMHNFLADRGARQVRTCVLLQKEGHNNGVVADYVGTTIADMFVVGYGLDYRECYRELPHIAALGEEERAAVDCGSDPLLLEAGHG